MRFFNTAGPVRPDDHYAIAPLDRVDVDELLSLIRAKHCFVLHAPRQAGAPLPLFSRPPTAGPPPTPEPLYGDELRLPLDDVVTAGDEGDLLWASRSSNESVVTVRIEGGILVVGPAYAAEGVARIEAMATDAEGQSLTVGFDMQVEFYWPSRPSAGSRGAVLPD